MPAPKYPLEPLLQDRRRKVDGAAEELGDSIRAREAAEARRASAEAAQARAVAEAAQVRAAEAERLLAGQLRAADLAHGAAWAVASAAEIAQLDAKTERAASGERDARSAEDAARLALAERMAERDVVAKDEERFVERTRKKALSAEEEAAEEVMQARLGGRR